MNSTSISRSGFALRINGTCDINEERCGMTVSPYNACCPAGSYCPSQFNVNCCPTTANCTASLVQAPSCANESWDLYDNKGYYYCCLTGFIGYSAEATNSDGCASPGYAFRPGDVLLSIVSAGETSTSVATATKSGSTLPNSSTPSQASSSEGPNIGAIIGGTIGAVVAVVLIGWLIVKRSRKKSVLNNTPIIGEGMDGTKQASERVELVQHHGVSELSDRGQLGDPVELAQHHGVSELSDRGQLSNQVVHLNELP